MKLTIKDITGKNQGELEVKFPLIEDGKGTQAVHDVGRRLPGRPAHGHRLHQERRRSRRHQQEAVAAEGHRPRPRRLVPIAAVARRRRGLRTQAPRFQQEGFQARPAQLALRKALSERLKAGDVVVVDDLKLASPKTKEFIGVMSALELKGTDADRFRRRRTRT